MALNYRIISLTTVAGKIFEKIARDDLVRFLEDSNIISDAHHSFRNKRSYLTNLLDFFHDIYNNWNYRIPSGVIYPYFRKAFEKVPHERLFTEQQFAGIVANLVSWMKDWLTGRK